MKWFGESWDAPLTVGACDWAQHVEVPKGEWCAKCEDHIGPKDQGVIIPEYSTWQDDDGGDDRIEIEREYPYHLDCFLGVILGHAWFGHYLKQTNVMEASV